jgi:hypothetical protein
MTVTLWLCLPGISTLHVQIIYVGLAGILTVREASQQLATLVQNLGPTVKIWWEVSWQPEGYRFQILDAVACHCALEQGTQPPTTRAPWVPTSPKGNLSFGGLGLKAEVRFRLDLVCN